MSEDQQLSYIARQIPWITRKRKRRRTKYPFKATVDGKKVLVYADRVARVKRPAREDPSVKISYLPGFGPKGHDGE